MTPNKILVANIGSTSFKFRLIEMPAERVLAKGGDRAHWRDGIVRSSFRSAASRSRKARARSPDHGAAIEFIEKALGGFTDLAAVGFKPVMALAT